MATSHRYVQIDILRIASMLMVICLHTILSFTVRPDFFNTKLWWLFEPITAVSKTSVLLFIMVSGYLVIAKNRGIRDTFTKTMMRIGLPLAVFTLLNAVFDYYIYQVGATWESFWAYESHKLLQFPSSSLWFLVVLVPLYLLNPVWNMIVQPERKRLAQFVLWGSGLFTVCSYLLPQLFAYNQPVFSNFTAWTGFVFLYLYGGMVRQKLIQQMSTFNNLLLFSAGFILTVIGDFSTAWHTVNATSGIFDNYTAQYASIPVLLMAVSLFNVVVHMQLPWKTGIIPWLAGLSFGIYLTHTYVIMVLSEVFKFTFDELQINVYAYNLINICIVIVVSIVITQIIKRIPGLKACIGG